MSKLLDYYRTGYSASLQRYGVKLATLGALPGGGSLTAFGRSMLHAPYFLGAGGALLGGAIGAHESDEHPLLGALVGGALGAAGLGALGSHVKDFVKNQNRPIAAAPHVRPPTERPAMTFTDRPVPLDPADGVAAEKATRRRSRRTSVKNPDKP